MRILSVMPYLPYPPDDGARIAGFQWLKQASQRHEIWLCAFANEEATASTVLPLRNYCRGIECVPFSKAERRWRMVRGTLVGLPPTVAQYDSPEMAHRIQHIIGEQKIDLVQLEHLHMACYVKVIGETPAFLILHNASSRLWRRYAAAANNFFHKKAALFVEKKMRRYEREALQSVPYSFALTRSDAEYLRSEAPGANIGVFPVALDEEYFSPGPVEEEEPYSIVFPISYLWPPKIHNLLVLLQDIFPRIKKLCPKAKLYVVGKGESRAIQTAAAKVPDIVLTGYVRDVRPYLVRAALVVQYYEIGSGIPLKLLVAFAMGKPVLSNSIGCEGIEASPGQEIAVADDRQEYAEAAVQLLEDVERRRSLAARAYRCAREKYFWPNVVHRLDKLYGDVLEPASPISRI